MAPCPPGTGGPVARAFAGDGWRGRGDTVDVALLAVAHKGGIARDELWEGYPLITQILYEPDLKYAASFHRRGDTARIFVKGSAEVLIDMADRVDVGDGPVAIDRAALLLQQGEMAGRGLRVFGFAEGTISSAKDETFGHHHLVDLVFLGIVGMKDRACELSRRATTMPKPQASSQLMHLPSMAPEPWRPIDSDGVVVALPRRDRNVPRCGVVTT